MMQMLGAGGLPLLTDGVRAADLDNPRGYFEYEPVKATAEDASWVASAHGKAVKVVSALLPQLPAELDYRVVFMDRPLSAVLASQRAMLVRRGRPPPDDASDRRLEELFARHLEQTRALLARAPNMSVRYVGYPELLAAPRVAAAEVARFIGVALDVDRMAATVEPKLARQH
jgi:hypothetical protein